MPDAELRDFLYLDTDKVRSFVAQLKEGVPEALEESSQHRGGGDLKLLSYAYEKTSSETRSIHHHLYSLLESYLLDKGRALRISRSSSDEASWNTDTMLDGRFLLASGRIRLLDFASMAAALGALPKIVGVAAAFQKDHLRQQLQGGQLTKQEYDQALRNLKKDRPETKDVGAITDLVQTLYGRTLRLRMYPYPDRAELYLVATLSPEYLQRQLAEAFGASGLASAGEWRMFGVLDRFDAAPVRQISTDEAQSLEDVLEGLVTAFSEVGRLTISVNWPVVAVTPVAVYREV